MSRCGTRAKPEERRQGPIAGADRAAPSSSERIKAESHRAAHRHADSAENDGRAGFMRVEIGPAAFDASEAYPAGTAVMESRVGFAGTLVSMPTLGVQAPVTTSVVRAR